MMKAWLKELEGKQYNNQLFELDSKRIWLWIRIATFIWWLLRTFAKPDSNWPDKYNALFKQFNNDDESGEAGEQEYKEPFKIGERILYVYEDKWYIGTILASNCRGGYDVRYDDASWDYNLGVEEMILLSWGVSIER